MDGRMDVRKEREDQSLERILDGSLTDLVG